MKLHPMKKILKISAAIIILLLISVYGYLQFREYRSYQNKIHKDAGLVFKINLDGIFQTMSADFISNPGYYLSEGKKEGSSPRGISLPANIFVYTLRSKSAGTYFCTLPVADSAALEPYLKRVFKLKTFLRNANGTITGSSADQKLTMIYNANSLAMAYSFKKEAVMGILNDLLEQKNMMDPRAPEMVALKKATGHLSWNFNEYSGKINFKDGQALVDCTFPISDLGIPGQTGYRNSFAKDAALKVWLNAGLTAFLAHQEFNFKNFNLQSDSLLKSYGAYVSLELGKNITQQEPVITYEYNDDFEKVAQTTLKATAVPHLKLSFGGNPDLMLKYLKMKNIINDTNQLNKELFPLYQVFSSRKDDGWQLSTKEGDNFQTELIRSPYFFYAAADFNRIKAQKQFPLLNSYLEPFTHLTLTATKLDAGKGRLQGQIGFKRKNVNSFSQLIK